MATNKPAAGWYVISPLHHNGVVYGPGDAVRIADEQGQALLALGVLSRVPPTLDAALAEPAVLAETPDLA